MVLFDQVSITKGLKTTKYVTFRKLVLQLFEHVLSDTQNSKMLDDFVRIDV